MLSGYRPASIGNQIHRSSQIMDCSIFYTSICKMFHVFFIKKTAPRFQYENLSPHHILSTTCVSTKYKLSQLSRNYSQPSLLSHRSTSLHKTRDLLPPYPPGKTCFAMRLTCLSSLPTPASELLPFQNQNFHNNSDFHSSICEWHSRSSKQE